MIQHDNRANPKADGAADLPAANGPAPGARRLPRLVVLPIAALATLAVAFFGYSYAQDQATYVSTQNAQVTGALIQVGSLNAGQVVDVAVDVGDRVTKGQTVVIVSLPSALGTTAAGLPRLGFSGSDDQQAPVRSPIDGIVVSRQGNPGDTVAPGQPLLTLIDPAQLWVQARIEEYRIGRIQAGQPVEVFVDALGTRIPGRVVAVDRATAATFSLLPQSNSSGNFTKVTQLVPVKIAIEYGQLPLVVGGGAEVKIRVQS